MIWHLGRTSVTVIKTVCCHGRTSVTVIKTIWCHGRTSVAPNNVFHSNGRTSVEANNFISTYETSKIGMKSRIGQVGFERIRCKKCPERYHRNPLGRKHKMLLAY